jgi:hypothetical protein
MAVEAVDPAKTHAAQRCQKYQKYQWPVISNTSAVSEV